jgi:hypothetical protein
MFGAVLPTLHNRLHRVFVADDSCDVLCRGSVWNFFRMSSRR